MGSIDTPSVVVGVGVVEDVAVGLAVGVGTRGTVLTGGGAWAIDVGTSKNPCTVSRMIALKQLNASAIDRLDCLRMRGFPGEGRFLSWAVLKDATVQCSTFSYFLRLPSIRVPNLGINQNLILLIEVPNRKNPHAKMSQLLTMFIKAPIAHDFYQSQNRLCLQENLWL